MNKKVLMIVVALLSVMLVAIPLVQAYGFWWFDRRTKSAITFVFYDGKQVGEAEVKECRGVTIKTFHWTSDVMVGGGAVLAGLMPALDPDGSPPYNSHAHGTSEATITTVYDPETGFGTIKTSGKITFDDFDGWFETSSEGKCGGLVGPLVAFFSAGEGSGIGKGALRGASYETVSGTQLNLINWPNPPLNILGGSKPFSSVGYGEIRYYPPSG
jgi:hypothetical protein